MSNVTQEQAKRLGSLGFPQPNDDKNVRWHMGTEKGYTRQEMITAGHLTAHQPSAEELMEWLKDKISFMSQYYADEWHVGDHLSDGDTVKDFHSPSLATALYECACWVLEGKK